MNYYFLLEDEKSFIKVLPKWLKHMNFPCERVPDIKFVEDRNYVLQSGQGVTQLITKVLFETIDTINENPKTIDKLIIILDAEEEIVEERRRQVFSKIEEKYDISDLDFKIEVFVCNHCFESWLLGCEWVYPKNEVEVESFFHSFYSHYDVSKCDPETMPVPTYCNETTAKYHFHYLHDMLRYKKMRYNKNKPNVVSDAAYFNGLLERISKTEHIGTFREFIDFVINESSHMQRHLI